MNKLHIVPSVILHELGILTLSDTVVSPTSQDRTLP